MKTSEIQIRDPFIFTDHDANMYYLFGTTDPNCWIGPFYGFDCYKSADLENWEGPIAAFRPKSDFWGKQNFWAPEVHQFNGLFYMFATFKAEGAYRATQILVAQDVTGPYEPLTDRPITPDNWMCLDGTLHVDKTGNPWVVFCHEWVQTHNGSIWAMQLSADLTHPVSKPIFLFNASEGAWVRESSWPEQDARYKFPTYVTDGPSLHRLRNGTLVMLWSSLGEKGYAMGISRSESGDITGPWVHNPEAVWAEDGGHGMIFSTLEGELMLTFHTPNNTPDERAIFVAIEETEHGIKLIGDTK